MAHILDGRVKELSKDVDRDKVARETVVKIAKEKIKAADTIEKKVAAQRRQGHWRRKGPRNSWRSKMRRI